MFAALDPRCADGPSRADSRYNRRLVPMYDFAAARHNMVESQIRPNSVTDPRLLDALAEIARERFVPRRLKGVAYVDADLEVAPGRHLMEPRVVARLLQIAEVRSDDVALDVGCATGYSSALLGRLAGTVVALESDEALAAQAGAALADVGADNVIVVSGPLAGGHPSQAPYDVILFSGAIDHLPPAMADQLAEGGRLVAVLREPGQVGSATLWVKYGGKLSHRPVFETAVPPLPDIVAPAGFVF